jgi:hypothetical protein
MPKIPTGADLGTRAVSPGNITPLSPNEFAAPARAVAQAGQAITGMAEKEYQRRTQLAVATAKSDYLRQSIAAQTEIAQTPDYNNWESAYKTRMDTARGEIAKNLQDPTAREAFELDMDDQLTVAGAKIADMARGKRIEAQRGGLTQLVNDNATALLGTADEAERQELMNTTNEAIDGAVANQVIDANEGVVMKRAHLDKYLSGRADTLDPVARIETLSAGMTRTASGQAQFAKTGTWTDFIAPDVRLKMIEAAEIDRDRDTRIKNAAKVEKVRGIQNEFVGKLAAGTLTAKEVLDNPDIEPIEGAGSKQDWLRMMREQNANGANWPTNGQLFADLFDRIHREDGDPEKILDENDLNQFVTPGSLNMAMFGQLRSEIQGRRTAEGSIEGDLKRRFVTAAKTSVSGSTELVTDPKGDQLHLKFMSWFLPEYEKQRKAGKSPTELLDPDSPDYMGKVLESPVYKRPMAERLAAMISGSGVPGLPGGTVPTTTALPPAARSDGRPANAPTAAPRDIAAPPTGMIEPGGLSPRDVGDNWATFEVVEDGVHKTVILPTQPGDKPADDATGFLGDAIERWKGNREKMVGIFEDEKSAQAVMKATAVPAAPARVIEGPKGTTERARGPGGIVIYRVGGKWVDRNGKPITKPAPSVPAAVK